MGWYVRLFYSSTKCPFRVPPKRKDGTATCNNNHHLDHRSSYGKWCNVELCPLLYRTKWVSTKPRTLWERLLQDMIIKFAQKKISSGKLFAFIVRLIHTEFTPKLRCVRCTKFLSPGQWKYCSDPCRSAGTDWNHMRKIKEQDPEEYERKMAANRIIAAKWREKNRKAGRCVRCGRENDRASQGYKLCSLCLDQLK